MDSTHLGQKDWYSILGAKPSDTQAEVKQKYQKLALLYHPDKQSADMMAGQAGEGAQRFIEINQAWKILGNEEAKKAYDLQQRAELTKMWPVDNQVHWEDLSWDPETMVYSFPCRCGGSYAMTESDRKDVSLVNCDSCSLIIEIL
uniref:Elongator acetyltransferase complex subunit 4 n=1 Tax=Xenopus tropicalis TaxID=8364 RepID=A0A803J562_XENTR